MIRSERNVQTTRTRIPGGSPEGDRKFTEKPLEMAGLAAVYAGIDLCCGLRQRRRGGKPVGERTGKLKSKRRCAYDGSKHLRYSLS